MPKAVILALLKRVASIDLPEILVEVEKGIFKSDLSKLQNEIQETRYSSGQYKCATVANRSVNKLRHQLLIQRKKQRYGLIILNA